MAAGHDLKEGIYESRPLSDDEMWSAFARLFSSKTAHASSYKFGFLKAILDNLYNVNENLVLDFDQLFSTFTEIYWNLVLKHHILQNNPGNANKHTSLESALLETKERFLIADDVPFESITVEMKKFVCHKVKMGCKNNVVGALYGDLNGLFYSFSKKGEWIQINPLMYQFVCKHKVAIEKLNYYEWARYLEKVNNQNAVDHLLSKIDESTLHTRNSLMYYRDVLFKEFESNCFYCGKSVTYGAVDVDHFIPWSFIKDDQLWNFVLSCPTCNNRKRDKLADMIYLDRIVSRNDILVERNKVNNEQAARIVKIYNWARQNGYNDIWTPSNKLEV